MSRRQEDLRIKYPCVTSRDRRHDLDHDPYLTSRSRAREEHPLRSRRSLSSLHNPEGSRRTITRDRRSNSPERRRESVRVGGAHADYVLSSSPPIERAQKRPQLDERAFLASPNSAELCRRQGHHEYLDFNNTSTRPSYSCSYNEHFDTGKEEDYIERRSGVSGHRSFAQNIMPIEDDIDQETQPHPNYGFTSRYEEACGRYSAAHMHRGKDKNTRYQDATPHEKLSKDVHYKDGEKYDYYSRRNPFLGSPESHLKDFDGKDFLRCVPGTSSSLTARGEYMSKVREVRALPYDEYSESYIKGVEHWVSDDYNRKTVSDTRRAYEPGIRDAKYYHCDTYASTRNEHTDNYPEIDASYTRHGNLYEKMTYVHGEPDRSIVGPDILPTVESISKTEDSNFSRGTIRNNVVRGHQKEMAQGYMDMRRSSDALRQSRAFLDYEYAQVESTKKVSNHRHSSEFSGLQEHEIEDPRLGYGYGRYTPSRSNRTRVKNFLELKNGVELQKFVDGSERAKEEEPVAYGRELKRKYSMDEDISKDDARRVIPSKYYTATGTCDFDDYQVEWTSRKSTTEHSKRPSGCEQSHYYKEPDQMSEETYHYKDSVNTGWTSYQNQLESIEQHTGKPSKMGSRHFKGYAKSESTKKYSHMHHPHQRSNHYQQHNHKKRNEVDNYMALHDQDIDLPEDASGLWKGELSEESEGFKQRVHAAFLDFSKRFNENPTARKLYKEQGKAGSLFCVVCRRSASKEFLDTKALATHAFMSHKGGLRPQHLGLHKAICVLMGWNFMPDSDSGTWIPEALPPTEALAQKVDLILWPPVVIIHNISLSCNDHNEWKLINIEALGDFLRAKGFSLGKIKICLGNPGDHSVILVKFLSTFSGLQEAERLHKYFVDRKHGRIDFEQSVSSIGNGDYKRTSNPVDHPKDALLYGYMGISEDMDKVDFDTKKKCLVKSKKEIHDIADAPVKPE